MSRKFIQGLTAGQKMHKKKSYYMKEASTNGVGFFF